jgi:hypothetical protein
MAGIRERDKRRWQVLDSMAYGNLVPRLFYVRNMFFFGCRYWPVLTPSGLGPIDIQDSQVV